MTRRDRVAIAAPRSFAKSSIFSLIYPLWAILYEVKKNIILVSATSDLSTTWVSKIKAELESNEAIIADFGRTQSDKWTETHIRLMSGAEIKGRGAGAQIRGMRPDLVVVDDVEDDESVRSEDQRKKLEDWFWAALVNTLEPTSQLIVVGTLLHPLSFLTKLIDQPRIGWETRKYQAIKPDGSALWKEKWPLDALLTRRTEIGERRFQSEFMNDPMANENVVFRREWIDMNEVASPPDRGSMKIITAVDPAISKADYADYTAIITIGATDQGDIYVLEAKRGRWSVYESVAEIFKTKSRFQPKQIYCEEIQYQSALREVVNKEAKDKNIPISIHPLKTDRDKVRRAQSVSHFFEHGKVHLLHGQNDLRNELITFPTGEHDDMNDCLVYALMVIESGVGAVRSKAKVGKRYSDIFNIDIATKKSKSNWFNL